MSASREVTFVNDFRGGLNLTTQLQSLQENETPDALNVDFGLRGGFVTRGGFQSRAFDPMLDGAWLLGPTYFNEDVLLIVGGDGKLYTFTGGALIDHDETLTDNPSHRVRMHTFDRKAYFSNAYDSDSIVMRSWDGTTLATLGDAWNNNYLAPSTGNMPRARLLATHRGFMFVANTVEGGSRFPHRVRFSHEQFPESWAEADYIDVEPHDDGDPITSILPFREMLLIFKRSSVWALYGYDRDSWVLERLTNASGVCACHAAAVNSGVAYWYSTDGQLMAFNGRSITDLSQPIRWWNDLGKIASGGFHRLLWSNDKLYLSLQAGSSEDAERWLFVWDPLTKTFTRYDKQVRDFIHWPKIGSVSDALFLFVDDENLYRFDRGNVVDMHYVDGSPEPEAVITPIRAYLRTAWVDAGETATRKRWKRPRITAAADADCTIRVRVFRNFDNQTAVRQRDFEIVTGEDSLWGTFEWGTDVWSSGFAEFYEFSRLGSSGAAHAIQYEFSSPDNLGKWWVDSVAVPFRRKQIR